MKGLTRAYSTVQVDQAKFLLQLRAAHRLPITSYEGVYSLEVHELDTVADSITRAAMKIAAVEGAGFGLGGLLTIVPDLGILSAITMRTSEAGSPRRNDCTDRPDEWQAQPPVGSTWLEPAA